MNLEVLKAFCRLPHIAVGETAFAVHRTNGPLTEYTIATADRV